MALLGGAIEDWAAIHRPSSTCSTRCPGTRQRRRWGNDEGWVAVPGPDIVRPAFTVLVTARNGTYSPALNGIEQCVATNFGSARQLMYNFVNRTVYIPMTVARDNWGTAATAVPERVVAFWVAKDDKFRLLGMGYAVTGGILTVRHLAFGPNSIQTAIARDEKVYVSRAHLRVKNLNDMQPIWRGGKKRVVVGPTVRTESDEVTRDFCLLKDPDILGSLGIKTKVLQFRTTAGCVFASYHYRFDPAGNGEYVLHRSSGITSSQPDDYVGTSYHDMETLPGDSGSPMLAGRDELVGMRIGMLQESAERPFRPISINGRQIQLPISG